MSAQEYRRHARMCIELAKQHPDAQERTFLIEMAGAWMRLAEQAEKNSTLDLVYETPPGPEDRPVSQSRQNPPDRDDT